MQTLNHPTEPPYFRIEDSHGPIDWGVNRFPDGQVQFWSNCTSTQVDVKCSLVDSEHVELLEQIASVHKIGLLKVLYLYGARSDKRFNGQSLVANVAELTLKRIKAIGATQTVILEPHCDTHWTGFSYSRSLIPYDCNIILYADASACRRRGASLGKDFVCTKERQQSSSRITKLTIPPNLIAELKYRNTSVCVVDDLCDGGSTFIKIAEELKAQGAMPTELWLSISHGVFSNNAVYKLYEAGYAKIMCSNSYPPGLPNPTPFYLEIRDVW